MAKSQLILWNVREDIGNMLRANAAFKRSRF